MFRHWTPLLYGKMESKFTAVLWDVDGTLLDFEYSQKYAITECFHTAGLEITEEIIERYSRINDSYWKRLELKEVTKAELLTGRFLTLFEELGISGVDVEAFRRQYQRELGNVYSYLDDSLAVCRSLKGKVSQYVITNGVASTQRNKLEISGLADVMDGIFISEEVGADKPDPGFFDICLERIPEKDREKILVAGDSLSSDIKGGIKAGLRTCWYRPEGKVNNTPWKPDYEISSLNQIYEVLGISK